MNARRGFWLALAVSLVLHLSVLSSPGWRLPFFDDPAHRDGLLEARLQAPTAPDAAPAKPQAPPARPAAQAAKPKPHARPKPPARREQPPKPAVLAVPATDGPAMLQQDVPEPAPAPVAGNVDQADQMRQSGQSGQSGQASAAAAEPAGPPVELVLPRQARIVYQVSMGERGFIIGESIQDLRQDGASYQMCSDARTTGLAGLLKPVGMVNRSRGAIVAGVLQPADFSVERPGGKVDSAHFDWAAGQVALSNGRSFTLETATQDMLSMFAQLALSLSLSSGEAQTISLPVVTGKKIDHYQFTVVGEERLATPRGERAAVHLRSGPGDGKESTEVWLGRQDSLLPIKIRFVDKRGDVFEQIAASIDLTIETEGWR